jgi:hypothetical protein
MNINHVFIVDNCQSCTKTGFTNEPGCAYESDDADKILFGGVFGISATSFENCRDLCNATITCAQFGYQDEHKKCYLRSGWTERNCGLRDTGVPISSHSGVKCSDELDCTGKF